MKYKIKNRIKNKYTGKNIYFVEQKIVDTHDNMHLKYILITRVIFFYIYILKSSIFYLILFCFTNAYMMTYHVL